MAVKQISVFLENKTGSLESMTKILADAGIDLRALTVAETTDFGIVRLLADDAYETATVLRDAGFICNMTPVLAVSITDEVGGLNKVLKVLDDYGVNVEYMYASLAGKASGHAYMIIRVADLDKAEAALRTRGFTLASQEAMAEM